MVAVVLLGSCNSRPVAEHDSEKLLRALVTVQDSSTEQFLRFSPGPMRFDVESWAGHELEIELATDEVLPMFSLSEAYSINEDGQIRPSPTAGTDDYALSDVEVKTPSIRIDLQPLTEGRHVVALSIPVRLEPNPRFDHGIEAFDTVVQVDLIYEVFFADSELDFYCARADQLLWYDTFRFDASSFATEGTGILTNPQVASLEEAGERFEQLVQTNSEWNPDEIFDLIEDICDVTYDERWHAIS